MSDIPPSSSSEPKPSTAAAVLALLRAIWRRIENVVFALVVLFIILYFVLQSSVVQNWLINKITGYLSDDLKTTVRVQRVGFEFFDNLVLDGFYVQDLKGDTLLYAERFTAGLNTNIFSIFQNKLEFNEISLTHARVNIHRAEGEVENTLQFILDHFSSPKSKNPSNPKPFQVRIKNLNLVDVEFLSDNKVRGELMRFQVPEGNVRVNNLDLAAKIVDIRSITLDGVAVTFQNFPAKPLPPDKLKPPPIDTISQLTNLPVNLSPKQPLRFSIGQFAIANGHFDLDDFVRSPVREVRMDVMDYNHLKVDKIDVQADSVLFDSDLVFSGKLRNLSAREHSGFELTHSQADKVVICDTLTALYGTSIQTAGSILGDTVMFHYATYRAYRHFNNEVNMDIRLAQGSRLQLGDITRFSEALARNSFFVNNYDKTAEISGSVDGFVNKLNGRNLRIRVGEKAFMQGTFDGDNMARGGDEMRLHFKFDRLQSDFQTIKSIFPRFEPPQSFYRLGNIAFQGTYDLQFSTFHILQGDLLTDIGNGNLSMQLDLSKGREKATYGGYMNLKGFDLGKWTGNENFGKTTFRFNIDDKSAGLTLPTIKAGFNGVVDSLVFKNYTYRNVVAKGVFQEKAFDGTLGIKDPNVEFYFDGAINMRDSIPQFLFSARVERIDLGALNLVNEDWVVSGRIEQIKVSAREWRDITGRADIYNFQLRQDGDIVHQLDSISFVSNYASNGNRYFGITTDVANAYLEGKLDLRTAGRNLQQLFSRQHPDFARQLGMPQADSSVINDLYTATLFIKDSKEFTQLITPKLGRLKNVQFTADVNAAEQKTNLSLDIPELQYDNFLVDSVRFTWSGVGEQVKYTLVIDTTLLGRKKIRQIKLAGVFDRNDLNFRVTTRDTSTLVKGLSLGGRISVADSLWQVQFSSSEIILFDRYWAIEDGNYLRFNGNYFEAKDFEFFSGNQRILLDTFNQHRGLSLSMTNFDLSFLNQFVNKKTFNCRGKVYDFDITVRDLYRLRDINAYIETDTVFINKVPYGDISGNVEMAHLASPVWWKLFVNYQDRQLRLAGAYLPSGDQAVEVKPVEMTVKPKEFQTSVKATNFPLAILETFIPGISKTGGKLNGDILLGGPFNKIGMNGHADIVEGQFQIDYLKTLFYIRNQRIALSNYRIWAEGDTIWDASVDKNMAIIRRGLTHNFFHDWRLDCEIESKNNNFLILNTLPNDNTLFYGRGAGKFVAKFTGTFVRTNIDIDATTGNETRLYIPISSSSDAQEVKFINFVDKTKKDTVAVKKRQTESELKGLNFDLNMTVTDAAEVQLIFDEQAGDIIKGRGEGNLQLSINRQGEFKMYGNYFIRRGEYLFTLLNFVNKPFTVTNGGSIAWYGDPYGAQINLDATYSENTPIYNFLRDELQLLESTQPELVQQAGKSTRVVVTMHLKGDLMKPTITFDLEFPNITSQLKTLADNKLRQLRQDPNELNRQVFGLVVVGSFLPSNSGFIQSSDYLTSAFNTLTQVFTNQLSNYLTGLAAEWFGGTVSSIDFDIAYNDYQNALTNPGSTAGINQAGRELQVRLTSGFVNDRITVQFGSQFGFARPGTNVQDGFLGEDITVEIQLTDNRQWRLKVYQRTEPDVGGGQRRARYGFGISFRRDYETFDEMMHGLTGWLKKRKSG